MDYAAARLVTFATIDSECFKEWNMMKWQEIRTKFPQSWVLVEAIEAHTEKSQRVIDRLSVIDRFPGFFEAMDVYKLLHHQTPNREMYVLHTQNEELTIEEHHWLGLRGVR